VTTMNTILPWAALSLERDPLEHLVHVGQCVDRHADLAQTLTKLAELKDEAQANKAQVDVTNEVASLQQRALLVLRA